MPLIEILTDIQNEEQLNKVIDKYIIGNNQVIYIKEKNIENIKNIKLETIVIDSKVENENIMKKIIENAKYLIVNLDFNENAINYKADNTKIITYGYNSKSDITVSSIKEEESLFFIQKNIKSIYGKKIEIQEIKANIDCNINIYNVMIIIALTILYKSDLNESILDII